MDIGIFDNFEDDGQLTLFGLGDYDDLEDLRASGEEAAAKPPGASAKRAAGKTGGKTAAGRPEGEAGSGKPEGEAGPGKPAAGGLGEREQTPEETAADAVRIRSCSSCGKLLFVREEGGVYTSVCNACGIQYIQKQEETGWKRS